MDLKNRGSHMKKCPTSNSVINIIPPRELWDSIQNIRTIFIAEARCGPHISFIDPFVLPEHFPEAAELLRSALSHLEPFTMKMNKLNYFVHKSSATLYLDPEFEPVDALQNLLQTIVRIFPQCDDTIKKSKTGIFIPHISIAKFNNEKELKDFKLQIEKNWQPIEFVVKEIYLLSRPGSDPFEIKEVVQLGTTPSLWHFGPKSIRGDESQVERSVVVVGLPKSFTDNQLLELFSKFPAKPLAAEIILNPDGRARNFGVVEFKSSNDAHLVVSSFSEQPFPDSTLYIKLLSNMAFPSTIKGCCSLKHAKNGF